MSHMKVIKIGQKYCYGHFEGFLVTPYVMLKLMSKCVNIIMIMYIFLVAMYVA